MDSDYMVDQKQIEALIAVGLYQVKVNAIKNEVRKFYGTYKSHLKPVNEVREILAKEIPEGKMLSEDIVKLRRGETH